MKTTNRKTLIAAVGSAGVLAMLITVALAYASGDLDELQAPAHVSPAVARTSLTSARLTPPPRMEDSVGVAKMAQAQAQADLLQKVERLESLLADADSGRRSRDDDDPDGDLDERAADLTPEAEEERAMAAIRAQVATLETTLDSEFVDKEWAEPAFDALRNAFESDVADGIELLEADCRSSMCRLTLAFDPALAEESFRKLESIMPWAGESFFQVEDVTSGEAIVYFSREDHSLPRAAE